MNTLEQKAENLITDYSVLLKKNGFKITETEKKQYNFEINVESGSDQIKLLVYFGKKGLKTVIQGNAGTKFYNEVNNLVFGEKLFQTVPKELIEPDEYIGTDESGKGDYFGPLVICGVYVDKEVSALLKKIGVKDSKELSDKVIKVISLQIKNIVKDKYNLVVITPEKYNLLHKKMGNVNKILGWAHAKVLENILENYYAPEAVSDKFGDESYIRNSLQTIGKNISLHQITKAERYTAVAAASILARDKFCRWFDFQEKNLGIKFPKGASEIVEEAAAKAKAKFGEDKLNEFVKLHFKTTKKII